MRARLLRGLIEEGAHQLLVHRIPQARQCGLAERPDGLLTIEWKPLVHSSAREVARRALLFQDREDLLREIDPFRRGGRGRAGARGGSGGGRRPRGIGRGRWPAGDPARSAPLTEQ